jgi:hypothetical protein
MKMRALGIEVVCEIFVAPLAALYGEHDAIHS